MFLNAKKGPGFSKSRVCNLHSISILQAAIKSLKYYIDFINAHAILVLFLSYTSDLSNRRKS